MSGALRHRLRGLPLLLGSPPPADVFGDLVFRRDDLPGFRDAHRTSVDVADHVGLTASHHRICSCGESRSDDAECFGVVCAPLDHVSPIHRGELRVDLACGVGRLDELVT
jgi:hypothetical protein